MRHEDLKILRDIEQYYSTQIDEMPMNVSELIWYYMSTHQISYKCFQLIDKFIVWLDKGINQKIAQLLSFFYGFCGILVGSGMIAGIVLTLSLY